MAKQECSSLNKEEGQCVVSVRYNGLVAWCPREARGVRTGNPRLDDVCAAQS